MHHFPGFRTGKLWKMILAFFGYLSFLYCSMTSDFTNAKTGLPLTGLQLWHERFFVFLMLLSLIFYNFNYKNIRTRSFLGHSLPFVLRIVLQCLISLGILVILMVFTDRRNHMVGSLSLTVKIYAVSETFLYEYLLLLLLFI